MTDPVDRGRNRSETFAEFARAEGKLKKLGLGPDVLRVLGTRIERITPEARQAWRERMAELAKSETAQLEAERRRAQAAEAGKLAAQSPNHVSRRTAKRRGLLEAAGDSFAIRADPVFAGGLPTVSLTGKTLPLARSRAILYAGHSVILITFVAKTAMFDHGVT